MKLKGKELKRIARGNLSGNFGIPMLALILTYVITTAIDLVFTSAIGTPVAPMHFAIYYFAEFLIFLVTQLFTPGNTLIQLNIARKEPTRPGLALYGFKNHPDRYILATLLILLISIIPAAPAIIGLAYLYFYEITILFIPLCILAYIISIVLLVWIGLSTQLVYYLLLDHDEMKPFEALKQSFALMKGNRGRLLYLMLSFIGIIFAAALTLGIGLLWVVPYINQTFALFYLDVTGELSQAEQPQQSFAEHFEQFV